MNYSCDQHLDPLVQTETVLCMQLSKVTKMEKSEEKKERKKEREKRHLQFGALWRSALKAVVVSGTLLLY